MVTHHRKKRIINAEQALAADVLKSAVKEIKNTLLYLRSAETTSIQTLCRTNCTTSSTTKNMIRSSSPTARYGWKNSLRWKRKIQRDYRQCGQHLQFGNV